MEIVGLPRGALWVRVELARARLVGGAVLEEFWNSGIALVTHLHGPRGALARNPLGSYALIALVALFAAVLVFELVLGSR